MTFPPERIVCLTEETVETLYLLGEDWRIVGVSGYAVRPSRVRREKPRVSSFLSADLEKILALKPDLVLTFSDLQAGIVRDLVKAGIAVHAFNHRDIAGILSMIRMLGGMLRCAERSDALARRLEDRLRAMRERSQNLPFRPRVYFEEWDEPMICAIRWVSELIEIAGGEDVFRDRSCSPQARGRIVDGAQVIAAAPNLILGSWCGKKFSPAKVEARPGFSTIPAVRDHALHEIKSSLILQPGPGALTDGLDQLHQFIAAAAFDRDGGLAVRPPAATRLENHARLDP